MIKIRAWPADVAATCHRHVADWPGRAIAWRVDEDRGVQAKPPLQILCTLTMPPVGTSCGATNRPRDSRANALRSGPLPTSVTFPSKEVVCSTCKVVSLL